MSNNYTTSEEIPHQNYIGTGDQTDYFFSFLIFDKNNVEVYLNEQLINNGFIVIPEIEGLGGTVRFAVAPAEGVPICISRKLTMKRVTDFQEGVEIRSRIINNEFNYQMACIQQIADGLNRSFLLPPYADTSFNTAFPQPEAHKIIMWNPEGNRLINSSIPIGEIDQKLSNAYDSVKNDTALVRNLSEEVNQNTTTVQQIKQTIVNTDKDLRDYVSKTLAQKSDIDFANVTEENARKLIGNRLWISEDYDVPNANTKVIVTHNLNLSNPGICVARVKARCMIEHNGYQPGEVLDVYTDNSGGSIYYNPVYLGKNTIFASRSSLNMFVIHENGLAPNGVPIWSPYWKIFLTIQY